jgi:RHS repeat-associated protein
MIKQGTTENLYFTETDNLGSIISLLDESGTYVEKYLYDPWGRRRNPETWSYDSIPTPTLIDRGFTGQEHLDEFGLINMNGRMYDPYIGRFLSVDPIIQFPGNSQSFNGYGYCLNNPLIYTDPSGFLTQAEWDAVVDFWNRMVTNPDQVPSGTYSLSDIVGGGGGDVTSGSGFQGRLSRP